VIQTYLQYIGGNTSKTVATQVQPAILFTQYRRM
jgi:hypothetical protein